MDRVLPVDKLDHAALVDGIEDLHHRITERFPDSGLGEQAAGLIKIAGAAGLEAKKLGKPNRFLQFVLVALICASVTVIAYAFRGIKFTVGPFDLGSLLQAIDSGTQEIMVIGLALFAVYSLEPKLRVKKARGSLQQLIEFIEVVDSHQLLKDPGRIGRTKDENTKASPKFTMTAFQLECYLDYCLDMISLTGKVAVLYSQHFPEVMPAVAEVQRTVGIHSEKIEGKLERLKAGQVAEAQAKEMEKLRLELAQWSSLLVTLLPKKTEESPAAPAAQAETVKTTT